MLYALKNLMPEDRLAALRRGVGIQGASLYLRLYVRENHEGHEQHFFWTNL